MFIVYCVVNINLLNYLLIWILYVLGKSNDVWTSQVLESATKIVKSFLSENGSLSSTFGMSNDTGTKIIQRDLWTQYICKVCYVLEIHLAWGIGPFRFTKKNALFCLLTTRELHLVIRGKGEWGDSYGQFYVATQCF